MGTNYYAVTERNFCEHCNRSDVQKIHIGKNSYGWAFSFQGYRKGENHSSESVWFDDVSENLTSWAEYREWLKDKTIYNEYDELIHYNTFVNIVETFGAPNYTNPQIKTRNLDHIDHVKATSHYVPQSYYDVKKHWHDDLGYSFSVEDFA